MKHFFKKLFQKEATLPATPSTPTPPTTPCTPKPQPPAPLPKPGGPLYYLTTFNNYAIAEILPPDNDYLCDILPFKDLRTKGLDEIYLDTDDHLLEKQGRSLQINKLCNGNGLISLFNDSVLVYRDQIKDLPNYGFDLINNLADLLNDTICQILLDLKIEPAKIRPFGREVFHPYLYEAEHGWVVMDSENHETSTLFFLTDDEKDAEELLTHFLKQHGIKSYGARSYKQRWEDTRKTNNLSWTKEYYDASLLFVNGLMKGYRDGEFLPLMEFLSPTCIKGSQDFLPHIFEPQNIIRFFENHRKHLLEKSRRIIPFFGTSEGNPGLCLAISDPTEYIVISVKLNHKLQVQKIWYCDPALSYFVPEDRDHIPLQ